MTLTPPPRRHPIERRQDPGLPRWVIASLAGLGVLSLVLGAFAVGLLLGRRPEDSPRAASSSAEDVEVPEVAPSPSTAIEVPETGPAARESDPSPSPSFIMPPPGTDPSAGREDGTAVTAYFAQMDTIAAAIKTAQDPTAMAQAIVAQAASGDMRGLDELLETQRALEERMAQLAAPPVCREHHRRSLDLVRRGISLLERVRSGLATQDMSLIGSVGAEGQALERDAKEIDMLGARIRREAGV